MGSKRHQKHKHDHVQKQRSAQGSVDRGLAALARGELDTALRELSAGWSTLKSDAARQGLVDATRRAAPELSRRADDDAVALLEQAVALAPSDPVLREHLAAASWTRGALDRASAALDGLLADPERAGKARLGLALIRARQGLPEVASKLLAGAATPGEPSSVQLLVELALALDARDPAPLEDLAAQRLTGKDRERLLYAVHARREGAVRGFLSAAKATLEKALADARALDAQGDAERLPALDVRAVLEPLLVGLEERLTEASAVRTPAGEAWNVRAARRIVALKSGGTDAIDSSPSDLSKDAPAELELCLSIARAAARGEAPAAFDRLAQEHDRLPAGAGRALAELIAPGLSLQQLTGERTAWLEAKHPDLADRVHALEAARALAADDPGAAAERLRRIGSPTEAQRAQLAMALELAGRTEEARPLWDRLLDTALGGPAAGLPLWFPVALDQLLRRERDRPGACETVLRRALAIEPARCDLRVVLAGCLLQRSRGRDDRAARDVLAPARPATPRQTCDLATMLAMVGDARRALELLAALPPDQHPPDLPARVDAVLDAGLRSAPDMETELALVDAADRLRAPSAQQWIERAELLDEMDREADAIVARHQAALAVEPVDEASVHRLLAIVSWQDEPEALRRLRAMSADVLAQLSLPMRARRIAALLCDRWDPDGLEALLASLPDDGERCGVLVHVLMEIVQSSRGPEHRAVLERIVQRIRRLGPEARHLEHELADLERNDYRLGGGGPRYVGSITRLLAESAAFRRRHANEDPDPWCDSCGEHHPPDDEEHEADEPVTPPPAQELPRPELTQLALACAAYLPARETVAPEDALRRAVVSVAARAVGLER